MVRCNRHGLERRIPDPVAREIRQACKFTCVLCDDGLVEYHHFAPEYVDATEHSAAGITLLCGSHHNRVTRGHLSNVDVAEADAKRRASHDFAGGSLLLQLRRPALVVLGPMIFEGDGDLLTIQGERVLGVQVEDGDRFSLWGRLFGANGKETLAIEHNVVTLRPENWDVDVEGPSIRIHSAPRRIALELRLWPPHGIHIQRLSMQHRSWSVEADLDRLTLGHEGKQASWDLANTALVCGGTTALLPGGNLRSTGGIIVDSGLGDRFAELSRTGKFSQIVEEVRKGTVFHVQRTALGWTVATGRGEEIASFTAEAPAIRHAKRLAATATMGRVVHHHTDGRLEVWFPSPE